jgi:DNA-binding NarL/FixJ family response regulator
MAPIPSPPPTEGTTIRVVHIDPEPDYRLIVRLALATEPDLELVGDAASLTDGQALVAETRPDLVLVEPHTGAGADVAGLAAIHAQAPNARLVALTALPVSDLDRSSPLTGAIGQLPKRVPPTRLAAEIRQLLDVLAVVDEALDEARTDLEVDLVSPRRARRFVAEALERWRCEDATAIIDLLVSEIVANAVIHAGTTAELSVQLLPERVRVSVTDHDPSHPKRRPSDPLTSTGRGIALIERLSLAWGIDRTPGGKRIWFETPRPDRPTNGAGHP